jgi:hypothetical protein
MIKLQSESEGKIVEIEEKLELIIQEIEENIVKFEKE